MPNLLGATPEADRLDFQRLWADPALRPDELKIYPCSLLQNAELYDYWLRGEFRPYADDELIELLAACKTAVPPYCRINRVIRDIPAHHVVAGLTRSNLREDVQRELKARGLRCRCIRCREVRGAAIDPAGLRFETLVYDGGGSREHFLSFVTPEGGLAGYLRLSLPGPGAADPGLAEIRGAALVREVHVYGPALGFGVGQAGAAQHSGLGTRLLQAAEEIARDQGYERLAVIAAIGTREYYRGRKYELAGTYMCKDLNRAGRGARRA
jgi:elongator complex protein 3